MYRSIRLFLICLTIYFPTLVVAAVCQAEEEFLGTVTGRNAGYLSVRLADGDTRRIRVDDSTRFFNEGAPVPQRRVLPHTLVRIAPKDGTALTVTILDAPK